MPKGNRYNLADKAISLLNKKAVQRFQSAQSKANLLDFDELNVRSSIAELYQSLAEDNRKAFLELAQMVYQEAEQRGDDPPDEDWLEEYLFGYSQVTKYVYAHEVERKRDYLKEAVMTAHVGNQTKATSKQEFHKALTRWATMTAQYADGVTDEATMKAYQDAGVKKVRWNTEHDEKVCAECLKRDGKVYSIDKVPPKVHWRCRCWLSRVEEK
jgi:SPP1 gp7 family putative phage head morphogenesis protein